MGDFSVKNINALEGFKELDDESIDCIITDPPYPTISGGKGEKILQVMQSALLVFFQKMMEKFSLIMILIFLNGLENVIAF